MKGAHTTLAEMALSVPRLKRPSSEQLVLDLGECARDAVNASVEAVHRANDLVRLYARHSGLTEEQAHHVLFAPGGVKEKRE